MAKTKTLATSPAADDDLDAFERRAAAATSRALLARAKFIEKLKAVDPSLVADFREFLSAFIGPLSELHSEHVADVRALQMEKKGKSR